VLKKVSNQKGGKWAGLLFWKRKRNIRDFKQKPITPGRKKKCNSFGGRKLPFWRKIKPMLLLQKKGVGGDGKCVREGIVESYERELPKFVRKRKSPEEAALLGGSYFSKDSPPPGGRTAM